MKLNWLPPLIRYILKPYILIILILAPFTLWVYLDVIFPHPPQTPQPYVAPRKKPIFINKKSEIKKQEALKNVIDSELSKLDGDYAVIIKDLASDISYSKNENMLFTSASIYKLAVMYKIFDLLEKNQISYSKQITTGTTVKGALNLMITVSDNASALALANLAGWNNIQSFLISNGIEGFYLNQETPQVTATAVDQLLEKIYFNKAVSQNASGEMKNLLLSQTINNRIPKYLPTDIQVAHKTGELDFVRHDTGIVFGKKSDYIFIFLSKTPAPENAIENIANLSKKIFDALEN